MKTLALLAAVLLLAGPAQAQSPDAPAQDAPPAAAPAETAASYAQKLDALYARRDQGDAPKQMEATLNEALAAFPDDAGLNWRAARWYFWVADTSGHKAVKEKQAKRGWDYGEKALAKTPDDLEARYWTALAIGVYGDSIGIVTALRQGIEGKFRKHLDYVVEKKPDHDHGGALVTLGRYYFTLPWPKKDADKGAAALKRCLKMFPDNLRARVFLAEGLLADDSDNAKEAQRLVTEVLEAKAGAYDAPEERFSQKLAKDLKPKIEEALK